MNRKLIAVGAAVAVLAVGGGGAAMAFNGGDDNSSVRGPAADQATAAALTATGGGKANAVERDNENGATYEVEVSKPDGSTVDVRLDASFHVVTIESDSETVGQADKAEQGDQSEEGEQGEAPDQAEDGK